MTKKQKEISNQNDATSLGSISTGDFKQSFLDTLKESNSGRTAIKDVIHEMLRDPETLRVIRKIVDECDRDMVKAFWKKFGFLIWSAFIFVIGGIVTVSIEKIVNK